MNLTPQPPRTFALLSRSGLREVSGQRIRGNRYLRCTASEPGSSRSCSASPFSISLPSLFRLQLTSTTTSMMFQYAHAGWLIARGWVPYRDFFQVYMPPRDTRPAQERSHRSTPAISALVTGCS
jgi:hypothetical protein